MTTCADSQTLYSTPGSDSHLLSTTQPVLYSPAQRQTPQPVSWGERTDPNLMPVPLVAANAYPDYYPGCWLPTSVGLTNCQGLPIWGVVFGSDSHPMLSIYANLWLARRTAVALEQWRIFGGRFRGRMAEFRDYRSGVGFAYGLLVSDQRIRQRYADKHWGEDYFAFRSLHDIRIVEHSYSPAFALPGIYLHTVPQARAERLSRLKFGGDVVLDLALCYQWHMLTPALREAILTPYEQDLYRLYWSLPKHTHKLKRLVYHPDAPTYR